MQDWGISEFRILEYGFEKLVKRARMAGIEKISIPQLGKDNWSIWKAKFQALLEYKGLMVAIEQPDSAEGRKLSGQAKALMILHTQDAYVKLIVGEATAAKAWKRLKENFEKTSNARIVQLTGRLTNLKLEEKESIAEYLGEFREIKADLEAAGQSVTELQLAVHALRGLPKEYATLRTIIEAGESELSLDSIQPKLMQREQELSLQREGREMQKISEEEGRTSAFVAKFEGFERNPEAMGRKLERRVCFACGKEGHIKVNCRFRDAECHKCGKRGHTKAVCRSDPGERSAFAQEVGRGVAFTMRHGAAEEWPKSWIVDSGSTRHVTADRAQFARYRRLARPEAIEGLGGELLEVVGIGEVELRCQTKEGVRLITLKDVRHVPRAKANLLALGRATDAGAEIRIREKRAEFAFNGDVCMEAFQADGLWHVLTVSTGNGFNPKLNVMKKEVVKKPNEAVRTERTKVVEIDLDDEDDEKPAGVTEPEKPKVRAKDRGTGVEPPVREAQGTKAQDGAKTKAQTRASGSVGAEEGVGAVGAVEEIDLRDEGLWITPKSKKRASRRVEKG